MTDRLAALLPAFAGLDVVVVGDVLLDAWIDGAADRLCREGPIPVVDVARTRLAPGGAGNTAANLAGLGARVRLVGPVGDDADGAALRRVLAEHGVDPAGLVTVPGRPTRPSAGCSRTASWSPASTPARRRSRTRARWPPRSRPRCRPAPGCWSPTTGWASPPARCGTR